MTATLFKLSKLNGLTRRITFPDRPSWSTLSSKIETLYFIPIDKIGVTYIDNDGDSVTLSSEEELQDFYQSCDIGQPIKLVVQDLRLLRATQDDDSKPSPDIMHPKRNTFGQEGLVFDLDDDWHNIPGLNPMFMPSHPESTHAFVEVVDSDINSSVKSDTASELEPDTTLDSNLIELNGHPDQPDKGKGKAREDMQPSVEDDVSSTGSVLAAEESVKFPVHVYDVSHDGHSQVRGSDRLTTPDYSPISTVVPIPVQSTPKSAIQAAPHSRPETPTVKADDVVPDPPLAPMDPPPPVHSPASLSNDVASWLNTLSTVFTSHPELSEGLRNIVRNAVDGTYWNTHRDAIAQAADGFRRSAEAEAGRAFESNRLAEDEAGRRVAEALGSVFRTFGEITATVRGTASPPASPSAPAPAGQTTDRDAPPQVPLYSAFRQLPLGDYGYSAPPGPPPPPSPPPPPVVPPYHPTAAPPFGPMLPPHIPSLFGAQPGLPPPHRRRPSVGSAQVGMWHRPPMPPPHRGGFVPAHFNEFAQGWGPPPPPVLSRGWGPNADPSIAVPRTNEWIPSSNPPANPSSYDLRAQVEAAKQQYKAEKERYRKDREERKRERERVRVDELLVPNLSKTAGGPTASPVVTPLVPPMTQLVSNARGPYPQLEMFSVSRKPTIQGRRSVSNPLDTPEAKSIQQITRRLADMGFTVHAYPSIPDKVKALTPSAGITSKDREDNIVTTLLEELLAMSPRTPIASGSNARKDRDIPGAWN